MNYAKPYIFTDRLGNNALSYNEREEIKRSAPFLIIPSLKDGTLDDVIIGDDTVFEEVEDGILKSCKGLKHFIRFTNYDSRITLFDNHNHALFFWLEAIREGKLQAGFELIHIDEHSDLWENENILDRERANNDEIYAWQFTNFSCNVGNYIEPARKNGIIENMIRIENEYQVDACRDYNPSKNSVLNLDLDFFAPEMSFIDEKKKIQCIRNLMSKVQYVTIATSPHFIEQELAISYLRKILI